MLAEGYSASDIKCSLKTTYNRIRRYASGDPKLLCGFDKGSGLDRYREDILVLLSENLMLKDVMERISEMGYTGKRTAFNAYCHKLIAQYGIGYNARRNTVGKAVLPGRKHLSHSIAKSEISKYIWSVGIIEGSDLAYLNNKYPCLQVMRSCVKDFRDIYSEKSTDLLDKFIDKYSSCPIKQIKSFASGLKTDYEAVKNSVLCLESNGYVEGNNNKIKAIKRTMYGRAGLDLLRAKVIYAR
jgi:hypothetical protein